MKRMTKTESKIIHLFATKRNEDGRIQVWIIPECKAAHKLAERGLVRVEFQTEETRNFRGFRSTVHVNGWLNVWMLNEEAMPRSPR